VIKGELRQKEPQLPLAVENGTPAVNTQQLRKLQKELRDLHAVLSKPAAPRAAVHTIRTPRTLSAPQRTPPRLFDAPPDA
jgi:hypothetical protein